MIRELEFNLLSRRHRDDIYRFARSILGNPADAEDATQEVLLRVWRNLPKVHLFHSRAWIMQMTRNLCLDVIRRRSHASRQFLADDEILYEIPDEMTALPGQEADHELLRAQISSALLKLPEVQRSVFVLYEINELRYHEIARTLAIPINSVKVYLSRARQTLRQLLTHQPSCMRQPID